ncbi:MAG: PASTA domain-containing protein [Myxococcota bacterium]
MSLHRTAPTHRRIHHVLGLGVSGAALAGLIYVESVSASTDAPLPEPEIEVTESTTTTQPASRAVPTVAALDVGTAAAPVAVAVAPVPATATATAPMAVATTAAANTQVAAMVTMPDVVGMKVNEARRELKKLGLVMTVRDSYNDKIPIEYQRDYKVRRQAVDAGTALSEGTWVRVGARQRRMRLPMGY